MLTLTLGDSTLGQVVGDTAFATCLGEKLSRVRHDGVAFGGILISLHFESMLSDSTSG